MQAHTKQVIFGTFSIRQTSSDKIAAGIIAMAAFLAPLIVTVPFSGLPPVTTYLSNETRPNRCVMFQLEHSIYHLSEKHNLRKI